MRQLRWVLAIVCIVLIGIYACAASSRGGRGVSAADNSRCYLCHLDFDGEPLVATHEARGVGCTACHGPSEAHMADEDHRTPPDKMFGRDDVNEACTACHVVHTKGETARRIARGDNVCTDCHGEHRIEGRTTDPVWN